MWAERDAVRYRRGYPGLRDDPKAHKNIDFYEGTIPSSPRGDFIKEIHNQWYGNHTKLEAHHGYIQWLFPIREEGLNYRASRLHLAEAKYIKSHPELKKRVIHSYEMMLDFYGMRLVDKRTGKIKRSRQYKTRYRHLNNSFHNYLRITRILKCLGELDLEYLKEPFLRHVISELAKGFLGNTYRSLTNYWISVVKDDDTRKELFLAAKEADKASRKPKWNLRKRKKSIDESDDETDEYNTDEEKELDKNDAHKNSRRDTHKNRKSEDDSTQMDGDEDQNPTNNDMETNGENSTSLDAKEEPDAEPVLEKTKSGNVEMSEADEVD